jgi:cytochrome c peroxidase
MRATGTDAVVSGSRCIGAVIVGAIVIAGAVAAGGVGRADQQPDNELTFSNGRGVQRTISTAGAIDTNGPFFQELGRNGRACVTCHQPDQAWSITPKGVRERFKVTAGLDPLFRNNDGSNCKGADLSTLKGRRSAFSLLLDKALIRVELQVPEGADFEIVDVDDPYGCNAPLTAASMYRRPLPSTNLGFLSTVMWDGRETVKGQAILADLMTQASNATTGHAEGTPPSHAQLEAIVDFERSLFTSQVQDERAGSLTAGAPRAGPRRLSREPFCVGINDPLSILPVMPGACSEPSHGLNPNVFTLFRAWQDADSPYRRAIARGEQIFNTRPFIIDNVGGLNGRPGDPLPPIQAGTCTVCHDTPNAGNHSVSMPLNLGLTSEALRTPDLPLYTIENRATHERVKTTDPGRAMVSGRWADIGFFKGPILRGLAGRAPYFHNGSAASLDALVEFYDTRFHIGLTPRDKADLVAFLGAL